MRVQTVAGLMLMAILLSCTVPSPPTGSRPEGRPLDTLPADADLRLVEQDLLATASDRFGAAALDEALSGPAYVIAKRFAGMAPPPPPGADPDWVPPTPAALLMKRPDGWVIATEQGWRPARAEAAAELDQVLADRRFWSEPALIPPCPDYGASLLLAKVPGNAAVVRRSSCTSTADRAVLAALRA